MSGVSKHKIDKIIKENMPYEIARAREIIMSQTKTAIILAEHPEVQKTTGK